MGFTSLPKHLKQLGLLFTTPKVICSSFSPLPPLWPNISRYAAGNGFHCQWEINRSTDADNFALHLCLQAVEHISAYTLSTNWPETIGASFWHLSLPHASISFNRDSSGPRAIYNHGNKDYSIHHECVESAFLYNYELDAFVAALNWSQLGSSSAFIPWKLLGFVSCFLLHLLIDSFWYLLNTWLHILKLSLAFKLWLSWFTCPYPLHKDVDSSLAILTRILQRSHFTQKCPSVSMECFSIKGLLSGHLIAHINAFPFS